MRIAILSDIHGNALALQAVLKDLTRQESVDQTIVAGDFFCPRLRDNGHLTAPLPKWAPIT